MALEQLEYWSNLNCLFLNTESELLGSLHPGVRGPRYAELYVQFSSENIHQADKHAFRRYRYRYQIQYQ